MNVHLKFYALGLLGKKVNVHVALLDTAKFFPTGISL